MTIGERVAVFWDYENCSPPSSVSGYSVANNVRALAHSYGSITLFKAYMEISEQSSAKSSSLRSELQSSGVSLTDCPHSGRKDVADKMMLVDMMAYAIDHAAPATLVLITGDRDFAYAASILRLRHYRIVLIIPSPGVHASLKSQASTMFDWTSDVLGRVDDVPAALPPVVFSAPPSDEHTLIGTSPQVPLVPLSKENTSSHAKAGSTTAPSPRANSRSSRRHAASISSSQATTSFIPPPPTPIVHPSPLGTHESLTATIPNCPDVDEPLEAESPAEAAVGAPDSPRITRSHVRSFSLPNLSSSPEDEYEYDALAEPPFPTDDLSMNAPLPLSFGPEDPEPTASTLDGRSDAQLGSPVPLVACIEQPDTDEGFDMAVPSRAGVLPQSVSAPMSGEPVVSVSTKGLGIFSPPPAPPLSSSSTPAPLAAPEEVGSVGVGPSPLSASVHLRTISSFGEKQLPKTPDNTFNVSASSSPTSTRDNIGGGGGSELPAAASLPARRVLPSHFRVLVDALKVFHSKGVDRPERTYIAQLIVKQSANIYTETGVQSFKAYSALAKQAGIVLMGSEKGGLDWISLHPYWNEVATATATTTTAAAVCESREINTPRSPLEKPKMSLNPNASLWTPPAAAAAAPNPVPAYFLPLIEHLEQLRSEGTIKAKRSVVAIAVVNRDPGIYDAAGVKSFKAYVTLAVEAGIVAIGGDDGTSWISLDERWVKDEDRLGGEDSPPGGDGAFAGGPASSVSDRSSDSEATLAAAATQSSTGVVSPLFQVLVEELEVMRASGVSRPAKAHVAAAMAKRKKSIGFGGSVDGQKAFDVHISLAQQDGVVLVGSDDKGTEWISLHPEVVKSDMQVGSGEKLEIAATPNGGASKQLGASPDVNSKGVSAASPQTQPTAAALPIATSQASSVHPSSSNNAKPTNTPTPPSSNAVTSLPGIVVPPQFLPLVEQLELYLSEGITRASRSTTAVALVKRDKFVYQKAGVQNFGAYTTLAERAGIVDMNKPVGGGDTWIQLRPEWIRKKVQPSLADQDRPSSSTQAQSVQELGGAGGTPGPLAQAQAQTQTQTSVWGGHAVSRSLNASSTGSQTSEYSSALSFAVQSQTPTPLMSPVHIQPESTSPATPSSLHPSIRTTGVTLTSTSIPSSTTTTTTTTTTIASTSAASAPIIARNLAPPVFQALVDRLEKFRLNGHAHAFRSLLGMELLGQDALILRKAGVASFDEYLNKAKIAEIVDFGGEGSKSWVCLRSKWYGCATPQS